MSTQAIAQINEHPLCDFQIGDICRVTEIRAGGFIHRRMLDLGIIEGTKMEVLHRSPFGDPVAYQIRGAVIALRKNESELIFATKINGLNY